MELKPCKCGNPVIVLNVAVQNKTNKAVYRYQCLECEKAAYAWTENKELAAEIWNDTVEHKILLGGSYGTN